MKLKKSTKIKLSVFKIIEGKRKGMYSCEMQYKYLQSFLLNMFCLSPKAFDDIIPALQVYGKWVHKYGVHTNLSRLNHQVTLYSKGKITIDEPTKGVEIKIVK